MGAVENLVAPGGPCEGAQVVFQEDNAGPHVEGTYREWMQGEFDKRGWKIELQAPQGMCTSAGISILTPPPSPSILRPVHQCPGSVCFSDDVQAPFGEAPDLEQHRSVNGTNMQWCEGGVGEYFLGRGVP